MYCHITLAAIRRSNSTAKPSLQLGLRAIPQHGRESHVYCQFREYPNTFERSCRPEFQL